MPLPYLQSYNDPKIEKAYRLYLDGASQRKILSKVKGLAQRTLARYCKNDGWEAERQARAAAAESPNVAAATAAACPETKPAATAPASEVPGTRAAGVERMLGQLQHMAGCLTGALQREIEDSLAAAAAAGRNLSRPQIVQLMKLLELAVSLQKKAWCVPDKIETKDTTPQKPDPIREMTDDQLERELAAARAADAAARERERASDSAGKAPQESIN